MRISDWSSDGCSSDLFWLLPECFASLAGFVTPEGGTPGMAHRQHVLSGPRSGEAEQAAFHALCPAKQEKYAAAYTACHQALPITEDLPDQQRLILSRQAQGIITIWHVQAVAAPGALEGARMGDVAG